jgi:hypothetical protein
MFRYLEGEQNGQYEEHRQTQQTRLEVNRSLLAHPSKSVRLNKLRLAVPIKEPVVLSQVVPICMASSDS